jgi:SWIM/SEC-C metal-binding protein
MGNRISDIGTMRSNVESENRVRTLGAKKTARLGTEKNLAVVSVQSEARFKEVTSIFEAHGWKYRIGLEPDKAEDVSDLNRLLNPPKPTIVEKKVGRNEPCPCGSGRKSKNCCGRQ